MSTLFTAALPPLGAWTQATDADVIDDAAMAASSYGLRLSASAFRPQKTKSKPAGGSRPGLASPLRSAPSSSKKEPSRAAQTEGGMTDSRQSMRAPR